jgi:hypothetical protein
MLNVVMLNVVVPLEEKLKTLTLPLSSESFLLLRGILQYHSSVLGPTL